MNHFTSHHRTLASLPQLLAGKERRALNDPFKQTQDKSDKKAFQVFFGMFDTYPAPLRMSRVTDRNGNWLNSDSYCIFHMACLHELGALRLQTAAPEYAAAPRDRRERLFVSLFTQHFSMRHNKLCDNKKKKERKQLKSAKRLNKRHVRTGTAGRGRPQI